jgi:hypothetical protein
MKEIARCPKRWLPDTSTSDEFRAFRYKSRAEGAKQQERGGEKRANEVSEVSYKKERASATALQFAPHSDLIMPLASKCARICELVTRCQRHRPSFLRALLNQDLRLRSASPIFPSKSFVLGNEPCKIARHASKTINASQARSARKSKKPSRINQGGGSENLRCINLDLSINSAATICAQVKPIIQLNRKAQAGDQLMVFWFIFLMVILAGGIIAGIYIFFGSEYDFRKVDAQVLNYRVQKCLSENEINWSGTQELNDDFYQKCRLNKEVINETLFVLISFDGKTIRQVQVTKHNVLSEI